MNERRIKMSFIVFKSSLLIGARDVTSKFSRLPMMNEGLKLSFIKTLNFV